MICGQFGEEPTPQSYAVPLALFFFPRKDTTAQRTAACSAICLNQACRYRVKCIKVRMLFISRTEYYGMRLNVLLNMYPVKAFSAALFIHSIPPLIYRYDMAAYLMAKCY